MIRKYIFDCSHIAATSRRRQLVSSRLEFRLNFLHLNETTTQSLFNSTPSQQTKKKERTSFVLQKKKLKDERERRAFGAARR
jgi:hypothetical protein